MRRWTRFSTRRHEFFLEINVSSAISKSARTRLVLLIQHNALVESVSEDATGVQMSLLPCFQRAWDDVASEAAPSYGPVHLVIIQEAHLVIIQEALAYDKKIVIAVSPVGAARPASEENNGARTQSLNEAVYGLGKPGVLNRLPLHPVDISARDIESNEPLDVCQTGSAHVLARAHLLPHRSDVSGMSLRPE